MWYNKVKSRKEIEMNSNVLKFKKNPKDFNLILLNIENKLDKTYRYIKLLKWLRMREWEMGDDNPLQEWFDIRNQIIETEKRLKHCLRENN